MFCCEKNIVVQIELGFIAMSSSNAKLFEEKAAVLMDNINSFAGNNKVPAWIKPFFESFKGFVKDVSDVFNELEGRLGIHKAVTDGLSKDREILEEKLSAGDKALQDQLQYSRRNMVLLHDIEEKQGFENTDEAAIEVFQKANVPVDKKLINRSHRLGKHTTDKKRPIIVSFFLL